MSSTEWQTLQCYIQDGLHLPTSANDAKVKLSISDEDVNKFADLWAAYATIESHCADFNGAIFPQIVALAGDIADFGHNDAPTYYPAITDAYTAMKDGSLSHADGIAEVQAILAQVQQGAQDCAAKVDAVVKQVNDFVNTTTQDQGLITPIKARYDKEYLGQAGKIQIFNDEITADQVAIAAFNAEYKQDCLIAETSASYCWIVPVGTIAAAVVAGVYAERATAALRHIRESQDDLENAETELRAAILLQQDLKLATGGLDGIAKALDAALPVLDKVKGVWDALGGDIDKILDKVDKLPDPTKIIPLIEELDVKAAGKAWSDLADDADQFRVNAFVVMQTEAEVKQTVANNPNAYDLPKAA
jgi:hypothetical protein